MATFDKQKGIILSEEEKENLFNPTKPEWIKNFFEYIGLPVYKEPKINKQNEFRNL